MYVNHEALVRWNRTMGENQGADECLTAVGVDDDTAAIEAFIEYATERHGQTYEAACMAAGIGFGFCLGLIAAREEDSDNRSTEQGDGPPAFHTPLAPIGNEEILSNEEAEARLQAGE